MDGGLAKVSGQAICRLELMTQRLRERKPLYRPWWPTTEQAPLCEKAETAADLPKVPSYGTEGSENTAPFSSSTELPKQML